MFLTGIGTKNAGAASNIEEPEVSGDNKITGNTYKTRYLYARRTFFKSRKSRGDSETV